MDVSYFIAQGVDCPRQPHDRRRFAASTRSRRNPRALDRCRLPGISGAYLWPCGMLVLPRRGAGREAPARPSRTWRSGIRASLWPLPLAPNFAAASRVWLGHAHRRPTCGAGKGQPCFRVVSGNVKELRRLHRSPAPVKKPSTRARHARQAHKDAQDLGTIIPVHPTRLRVDRSPRLAAGQVYATHTGKLYHPVWCIVVATKWDTDPDGLVLIAEKWYLTAVWRSRSRNRWRLRRILCPDPN
ncbi:hypothetical protein SRABI26_02835 [Arthrobacter sp. Bi26]|nr:hypothetical protein SRABI26_02835 [Arthrobacter sp. Bi26]